VIELRDTWANESEWFGDIADIGDCESE